MSPADGRDVTVDIIAATYQGAAYLPAFLESLARQTHAAWRLWVRDDGSTDGTTRLLADAAAADPRIRVLPAGGAPLGATANFARVLSGVPADARYVMCADQDDVWRPGKIARTLACMRAAEADAPGPVLVHTDLTVVDEALRVVHPSYWAYTDVRVEPATLRRVMVQNVATGATIMMNAALRARIGEVPPEAFLHDWWFACVAAAFGRVVALPESTILYRQHGGNAVGASPGRLSSLREAVRRGRDALAGGEAFRAEFRRGTRQAAAFLERYGPELSEADRRFLHDYARLPDRGWLRRKADVLRYRLRREYGLLRNLGVLFRA